MATLVLDLKDRRPLLAFPEWARDAIASAAPAGWTTAVLDVPADGSGDGAARASPELLAEAADARVYVGYGVPAEFVRAAPRLEWVHSGAAGVASSLGPDLLARSVRFTNSAGVHGPPIAETVLAAMLYFARGLDLAARAQREGRWAGDDFWGAGSPVVEMSASVVGVIGYGGIGRGVAARALALGSRVLALRRHGEGEPGATGRAAAPPAPVGPPARMRRLAAKEGRPGGGTLRMLEGEPGAALRATSPALRRAVAPPAGQGAGRLELRAGRRALADIAAESDYLVVAAPETRETRGMIDERILSLAKPGAVLVNVARGGLVDEDALLGALNSGRLRGAALDVFCEEPLPPAHPFFSHPRVLVTPHVSAATRGYWERQTALIVDNVQRFARGDPLLNLVDPDAGY